MKRRALGLPELEHIAHVKPLLEDLHAQLDRLEKRVDTRNCDAVATLAGSRFIAGKIAGHLTGLKSPEARALHNRLRTAENREYALYKKTTKLCRRP